MAFEFVAFALIALVIVFLIEKVYRKLIDLEKSTERIPKRFRILEERYQKQAQLIKILAQKIENQSKGKEV